MTKTELKIKIIKGVISRISDGTNNYMCLALARIMSSSEIQDYLKDIQMSEWKIEDEIRLDLKALKPADAYDGGWFEIDKKGKAKRLKILKTILKQYQDESTNKQRD